MHTISVLFFKSQMTKLNPNIKLLFAILCITVFLTESLAQERGENPALISHGKAYIEAAKYDSAIVVLEQAVEYFKTTTESKSYVSSLSLLGEAFMHKASYKESETHLRNAVEFGTIHLDNKSSVLADAYYYLSRSLGSQGKYQLSNSTLDNALSIRESNGDTATLPMAKIYNLFSYNFRNSAQYDTALYFNQKALDIQLELLGENDLETASSYYGLGWVHAAKGNVKKSLALNLKSFEIRKAVLGEKHPTTSQSVNMVGWCYRSLADYESALEYYQLALDIRINSLGNNHPNVAHSYSSLASIYANLGNYDKAIFFEEQALKIGLDKFGPGDRSLMVLYNSLGSSLYKKGDYEPALSNLMKSISIGRSELEKPHPDLAKAYKLISRVFNKTGEFKKRHLYLEKARDIELVVFGPDHQILAETYHELGEYYSLSGNHQLELENYANAEAIIAKVYNGFHPLLAQIKLGQAAHERKSGYPAKAVQLTQEAFMSLTRDWHPLNFENPAGQEFSSGLVAVDVYREKGLSLRALATRNQDDELLQLALDTYLTGIEVVQNLGGSYVLDEAKTQLAENSRGIFSEAVDLVFELHSKQENGQYIQVAFELFERSKSFTLLKALNDTNAKNYVGIPDSVLRLEREQRVEIAFLRTRLLRAEQRGNKPQVNSFQSRLFVLQNQRDSLVRQLEYLFPAYYRLKYKKEVATLKDAQKLLDSKTAVLSFFWGEENNYLFAITSNSAEFEKLENTTSLASQITQLRKSISDYELILENPQEADSLFMTTANTLYRSIFTADVVAAIDGKHKLILVPDGQLNNVNFEALLKSLPTNPAGYVDYGSLDYLINDFAISYAFSCTILTEGLSRTGATPKFALAGYAPAYQATSKTTEGITALPGATNEVMRITRLVGGKGWYGTEASETAFKMEAHDYRILHLAMHANLDNHNPGFSELLFDMATDSLNDGRLNLAEIYNLQLNAELVVLSACNTGNGLNRPGEGTISLSRAFRYAGAPSIIMSTWQIPDNATNSIMVNLYQNLMRKQPKDEALRDAKLRFIKESNDPLLAHPYFWAGITPIGNMQAIDLSGGNDAGSYLLLVALCVAIVITWRRKSKY